MSVAEIIKNRRATPPRLFAKRELPNGSVEELLRSANWAPNHKKTEPWRFKVYRGKAKAELAAKAKATLEEKQKEGYPVALEKIEKFVSTLERVPVAIAVVLQPDPAGRLPEWEEIAAVSMAVQNMWLTATELELAAFWATPTFMELFDELLELEDQQKSLGFFYVGQVMMDFPSPGRNDWKEKVDWKD